MGKEKGYALYVLSYTDSLYDLIEETGLSAKEKTIFQFKVVGTSTVQHLTKPDVRFKLANNGPSFQPGQILDVWLRSEGWCCLPAAKGKNDFDDWEMALAAASNMVGESGRRVDETMREIVAALNMAGIRTLASGSGTFGKAMPFPWVESEPSNKLQGLIDAYYTQYEPPKYLKMVLTDLHNSRQRLWVDGYSYASKRIAQLRLTAQRKELRLFAGWLRSQIGTDA